MRASVDFDNDDGRYSLVWDAPASFRHPIRPLHAVHTPTHNQQQVNMASYKDQYWDSDEEEEEAASSSSGSGDGESDSSWSGESEEEESSSSSGSDVDDDSDEGGEEAGATRAHKRYVCAEIGALLYGTKPHTTIAPYDTQAASPT